MHADKDVHSHLYSHANFASVGACVQTSLRWVHAYKGSKHAMGTTGDTCLARKAPSFLCSVSHKPVHVHCSVHRSYQNDPLATTFGYNASNPGILPSGLWEPMLVLPHKMFYNFAKYPRTVVVYNSTDVNDTYQALQGTCFATKGVQVCGAHRHTRGMTQPNILHSLQGTTRARHHHVWQSNAQQSSKRKKSASSLRGVSARFLPRMPYPGLYLPRLLACLGIHAHVWLAPCRPSKRPASRHGVYQPVCDHVQPGDHCTQPERVRAKQVSALDHPFVRIKGS